MKNLIKLYLKRKISLTQFLNARKKFFLDSRDEFDSRPYQKLIEKYLNNEISGLEFSSQYLNDFKNSSSNIQEKVFMIMQSLFEVCDGYSPSWTEEEIKKDKYFSNEEMLKKEVLKVREFLENNNNFKNL